MWFQKQRTFSRLICSNHKNAAVQKLGILLFLCLAPLIFAGCQNEAEKQNAEKSTEIETEDQWKPLEIQSEEKKAQDQKADAIEKIYERVVPGGKKEFSDKGQGKLLNALEKEDWAAADVNGSLSSKSSQKVQTFYQLWEEGKTGELDLVKLNPSGGFSLIALKKQKSGDYGILTTVILGDNGKFSISEMVKYKVKDVWIEKKQFCCEFYLSDQAELQTDGTMKFHLNNQ